MSADPGFDELDDDGLASPRTALAWQRTGLTQMATGAGFLRLLPSSPYRIVLAVAMIVVGAVVSLGSRRMHPGRPHRRSIAAVCTATTAAAAVAVALTFS
jgi:uncharacterized membrane protein YidH (DUF202 family)